MTPTERANPAIFNGSRRKRVAMGSGTNIAEVNRLMKQFDDMRKMMKNLGGGKNMMRAMGAMRGVQR
ncbi:MAG: signal recognition particle protein, partial [Prevotellaceae bacterium]|jgi:signal recognition particle subunit SRP54|nr:signal recognition particle protein [Prevotellaceae bacterium]